MGVRNHIKLGVSTMILYCVVDTGYGLCGSLGDCRPALPKGRKYKMVKTQTESHDWRPIVCFLHCALGQDILKEL